jgi:hypothetical protein
MKKTASPEIKKLVAAMTQKISSEKKSLLKKKSP